MRAEDKQLEGPDLERDERTRSVKQTEEEELPVLGGEELRDAGLEHRSRLFDAVRVVLAGGNLNVSLLYLPQREAHALEALQTAVNGQDSVGEFVFAEDRRGILEQALAVLQQNLTYGNAEQVAELHAKFEELTGQVIELRERLTNLEDAQEEMFDDKRALEKAADRDDEDKPEADSTESTLSGVSSLTGPEPRTAPKPPSTLTGPEQPAEKKPPSTLSGPEPAPAQKPASIYDPPDASALVEPAAKADDAKPTEEEAKKKPWWRKPFG